MENPRYFRFQIWHMLVLVALVAIYLWLTTQAAMETCEIEIIEIAVSYHENLEASAIGESQEWTKVKLRFLSPIDLTDYDAVIMLNPMEPPKGFENPERIKFRYRSRNVFWLPRQDPLWLAIENLKIGKKHVQEIITEKHWPEEDE